MITKIKSRIKNAFSNKFNRFASSHSRLHQGLAFCLAVAGYAFLYSFPLMVLIGVVVLLFTVTSPMSLLSVIPISIAVGCIGVGVLMSVRIATIRFQAPEGLALDGVKFPQLFQLLDEVQDEYKLSKVDRLIIIEPYTTEIYKTPVNGFAYWSRNTLAVGIPLMLTLSPDYFGIVIRRKLIQYSKKHNAVSNWMHQLRYIWSLYAQTFKNRNAFGDQLVCWFFSIYAPMYEFFTRQCAQLEELHADKNAWDMVVAEELLKTIETMLISETFLQTKYWPKIVNVLRTNPKATPPPFNSISAVTVKTLAGMDKQKWLINHFNKDSMQEHYGTKPPLKKRMAGLGCSSVEEPEVMKQSAAQVYLGNDYAKVVMFMNKVWLNRVRKPVRTSANPVVPLPNKKPNMRPQVVPATAAVATKK